MADTDTGMPVAEMKKMIQLAKKDPISVAFAQGGDPSSALLMFDKVKGPEAVKKILKDVPGFKKGSERAGTGEVDEKTLTLKIDKASSGMAKKLVKTLKGTGIGKVIIFCNGEECESHSDEAPPVPGAAAAPGDAAPAAADGEAAPPPPPAPPVGGPPLSAVTLTAELRALIGRIGQADPAGRAALAAMAGAAQAALKVPDLAVAAVHLGELKAALDAAGVGAAPVAAPAAGGAPAGAVAYAKSRMAWIATRKKVEVDIERLRSSVMDAYKSEAFAGEIDSRFSDRVRPVLETLDETLSDKLDEMVNATDAALRTRLAGEAQAIMKRYADFVAAEPIIGDLDNNPFAPLAIRQTLTATLAALSAAVK